MKGIIAAVLAFIALHSFPAFSQEIEQSFYHNTVLRNFEAEGEAKVLAAMEAIVAVVETHEFKETVLNFTNKKGERKFLENNGLSNEQIYQIILEGAEKLKPSPDRTMDMDLTWYYSNNSTVGYTYANTMQIWVNAKFYRKYDVAQVSRNLFHEWTHKLGFGHTSGTKNRPWTVPYGLGGKMEELVRKHLNQI